MRAIDVAVSALRRSGELGRDYYYSDHELRQLAIRSWPSDLSGGKYDVTFDSYAPPERAAEKTVATICWEHGLLSKYRTILAQCWLEPTRYDRNCDKLVWEALRSEWVCSWQNEIDQSEN